MIEVEIHILEWQSNPERYRPVLTQQGTPVFRHRIAIPGCATPVVVKDPCLIAATTPETAQNSAEEAADDMEAAMGDEDTRNLVFRFWGLTVSQRREIALLLGLIDEKELELPEPERYGRALLRAGERNMLDQVAHEVAQRETR